MDKKDRDNNGNIHPDRIFQTPNELKKEWDEYKAAQVEEAKKWPKVQYVGKDGNRVTDYPVMPLTIKGFWVWYYNKTTKFIRQYFDNKEGYYEDFVAIVAHIKDESEAHNVAGSMLGHYRENITNRLHGLTDKSEQELKGEGVIKVTLKK